jgi:AcrR family transcriptional regulator
MATSTPRRSRGSNPRERLLRTASELFYREGIHSVGVDRIVAEASVTRATFYRHFRGKEALVLAYLESEDAALRALFESAAAQLADADGTPEQLLEVIIQGIADDVSHNHTRGCPFINASAEYPDAASAVRTTVAKHRAWFRATLEAPLIAAGHSDAAERAGALVLLRDAALVGGYLDGPGTIRETFIRTSRQVAGL